MNIDLMHISRIIGQIILCCFFASCHDGDQLPDTKALAFPGADGGGKYVKGGRGGVVYHVTSLSDDPNDMGSLRHAINMAGARTIVFDVSGTIQLNGELKINNGALTIAGQTAPGDGICIAGYPVTIKTGNVILRFLRFRMGGEHGVEGDALSCVGRKNIMIDHCSFSWSTDECVSCYGNEDFTLQYCIIAESLRQSVHQKGKHGYAGIWGGTNASFHHNLLAHHDSRNPRFDHEYVDSKCHGPLDYVNNVVYNWSSNSAYGGEGVGDPRRINFVNNYYKPGPATPSSKRSRLLDPTVSCSYCSNIGTLVPGKFFLHGNFMHENSEVTQNNWQGSTVQSDHVRATHRWTDGLTKLQSEQSAVEAYQTVLAKAGCSKSRDVVDVRIVEEVINGTFTFQGSNGSTNGLIDSQQDVGGWPELHDGEVLKDSDYDGIPDEWEMQRGLNPADVSDGKSVSLAPPYTNLEVYMNSLVLDLY